MSAIQESPRFTEDAIIQAVQTLYGLQVSATRLPGEQDQNFLLTRGGQPSWVLKIANRQEQEAVLAFQNEALTYLAQREPSLTVPRVLPSLAGQGIGTMFDEDGHPYLVRLFSYLEGIPLVEAAPYSGVLLVEVGRLLGRLDSALAGFSHPAARRPLRWSIFQAHEVIIANLDYLTDPARRALVEGHLNEFQRKILPRLAGLRSGIIHNDANDYNILVHGDAEARQSVAGLLDFGDLIQAPIIYEAAVAASYVLQNAVDPLSAAASLVSGYHERFPLISAEIELLLDLITIRLCTTVTMAARNAIHAPDKPYLVVSQDGAWRTLEYLDRLNRSAADAALRAACGLQLGGKELSAERERLIQRRNESLGPSLTLSYRKPLHIVRGFGQYLFNDSGRAYLDCVNNVAHVGHCHPKVVAAGQQQMAILNTNTRYLSSTLLDYAERLTSTLPEPLTVCYFVCSGSEANELALRLARTYTSRQDMIVLDGAYHGNTATLVDHSPYKHDGPCGAGAPAHVHKAPMPDPYRGLHTGDDAGQRYASTVRQAIEAIQGSRDDLAGFICEPLLSCGGQIVPPKDYLRLVFDAVRQAGGVCITDEVQVGFGRVGTDFWAFESQGVVPDIVTMGKPMGNGHPLAAVVTTPQIAAAFANGMEYFNTFGGNPVSCAIGQAVLKVIEEEGLQQRALVVGRTLMTGLNRLMDRHELIGDVRGQGLFIGLELVGDRQKKSPAAQEATIVVEKMKARGILLSTDGPDHNVIKIKPPLVISQSDAQFVVSELDTVLNSL